MNGVQRLYVLSVALLTQKTFKWLLVNSELHMSTRLSISLPSWLCNNAAAKRTPHAWFKKLKLHASLLYQRENISTELTITTPLNQTKCSHYYWRRHVLQLLLMEKQTLIRHWSSWKVQTFTSRSSSMLRDMTSLKPNLCVSRQTGFSCYRHSTVVWIGKHAWATNRKTKRLKG